MIDNGSSFNNCCLFFVTICYNIIQNKLRKGGCVMPMFKKGVALLCSLTMLGGVVLPAVPPMMPTLLVNAADSQSGNDIVITDAKTGEIISADRVKDVFNGPAEDELDSSEPMLDKFVEYFKYYEETLYRAEHYIITGRVSISMQDTKTYGDWVRTRYDSYDDVTHLFIIRDIRITRYSKEQDEPDTSGMTPEERAEFLEAEKERLKEEQERLKDGVDIDRSDAMIDEVISRKYSHIKAGTFAIAMTDVTTNNYRTFTLKVKQPTNALKAYTNPLNNKKKTVIEDGLMLVNNHGVQFTYAASGTDDIKMVMLKPSAVDFDFGREYINMEGVSDIVTISDNGVITPSDNGRAVLLLYSTNDKIYYNCYVKDKDFLYTKVLPKTYDVVIVKENPAREISINNKVEQLNSGEKYQLGVEVTPTYNTDEYPTSATDVIAWSSSDEKVASIDETGLITAKQAGTTIITVTGENLAVKDSFVLTVKAPVTQIKLSKSLQTMEGEVTEISAVLNPKMSNEQVYWESSDESIVTVEQSKDAAIDGENYNYYANIKAIKAGTAIVTASTKSGIKASMTVTVEEKPVVDWIKLMYGTREIKTNNCYIFTGENIKFTMTGMQGDKPIDKDTIVVTISKGGKSVAKATINKYGVVSCTGIARGTVNLIFKSTLTPGVKRVVTVHVKRPANGVDALIDGKKQNELITTVDSMAKITAKLKTDSVDGIHDDEISTYKSSDKNVVTVDKNGNVKAVGEGTAKIVLKTASTKEFTVAKIIVINVSKILINGVSNNTFESDKRLGEKLNMKVQVATNADKVYELPVTYTLDNSGVLSLNDDNELIVNKVGTTKVKVTAGGVSNTITVKINHKLAKCKFNIKEVDIASSVKPNMTITDDKYTLKEGVDYTVDTVVNPKLGSATTTVHGKGGYTGDTVVKFNVVAHDITKATVTGIVNKTYTGTAITQSPVVKYNGTTLKLDTDYTLKYSNNTDAGVATVTINGINNYRFKQEKKFTINKANISSTSITIAEAIYSEKNPATPKVTITYNDKSISSKNYTLSYSNNTKVGMATVKIVAANNFSGTITKQFKVMAKTPLSIKLSTTSATLKVGGTIKPTVTIADAAYVKDKTIKWKSSNSKVATVDASGKITAKKAGTAVITAAGGKTSSATIKITVK